MRYMIHRTEPRVYEYDESRTDCLKLTYIQLLDENLELTESTREIIAENVLFATPDNYDQPAADLPINLTPAAVWYDDEEETIEESELAPAVIFSDHDLTDDELAQLLDKLERFADTGDVYFWSLQRLNLYTDKQGHSLWCIG